MDCAGLTALCPRVGLTTRVSLRRSARDALRQAVARKSGVEPPHSKTPPCASCTPILAAPDAGPGCGQDARAPGRGKSCGLRRLDCAFRAGRLDDPHVPSPIGLRCAPSSRRALKRRRAAALQNPAPDVMRPHSSDRLDPHLRCRCNHLSSGIRMALAGMPSWPAAYRPRSKGAPA